MLKKIIKKFQEFLCSKNYKKVSSVFMLKKITFHVFLIFSILCFVGAVYGSSATDFVINSHNQPNLEAFQDFNIGNSKQIEKTPNSVVAKYKKLDIEANKKISGIKKTSISKSIFKSGANINLKVYTDKSIKSVQGSIVKIQTDKSLSSNSKNTTNTVVKYNYKFKKSKSGFWYYKLNTKKYKSGEYGFKVIAKDNKNKNFKDEINFTVDNIPPKIFSITTDLNSITAGDNFTITVKSDNTTKKVIANIKKVNISLKKIDNETWIKYTNFSYKEVGNVKITISAYDSLNNFQTKTTYIESEPKYVLWSGILMTHEPIKVSYPNPTNAYERSVKELSKYATVYEGHSGSKMIGNNYFVELGSTYKNSNGKTVKYQVIIAYKDPFIVYHEMAHVLNWGWSEYNCNWYAYNRTGYWYSNVDNSKSK
jgi:hypothetical protein